MKAKRFFKLIMIGLISVSVLSMFAGCKSNEESNQEDEETENATNAEVREDRPKVEVEMESGEKFIIELYPQYAPITVDNFVKLVKEGFYDGLTFHRIVDDFMAQGGDPEGTGMGGSPDTIKGEFSSNGYENNTLSHTKGIVSMARVGGQPDSASSQFFIMLGNKYTSSVDGEYAAFGKVIEGMEVVENFLNVERTMGSDGNISSPVEPVVMKKVTIVEETAE